MGVVSRGLCTGRESLLMGNDDYMYIKVIIHKTSSRAPFQGAWGSALSYLYQLKPREGLVLNRAAHEHRFFSLRGLGPLSRKKSSG